MADEAEDLVDGQEGAPAPEAELNAGEGDQEQQQKTSFDAEAVARLAGWAPKEEWRGEEGDWKDAETFIADTVTSAKTARQEAKSLKKRLETTTKAIDRTLEQQRRDALEQARAEIRRAVEDGDTKAADKAMERVEAIQTSQPPAEFTSFQERNDDWFNVDAEATAYAITVAQMQADQGKGAAEQLEAAEKAVRRRFPEFAKTDAAADPKPKPKAPSMGGGQRTAQPRKGAMTLSDLPREAQEAAKRFERRGVKLSDFIKNWQEENAQ